MIKFLFSIFVIFVDFMVKGDLDYSEECNGKIFKNLTLNFQVDDQNVTSILKWTELTRNFQNFSVRRPYYPVNIANNCYQDETDGDETEKNYTMTNRTSLSIIDSVNSINPCCHSKYLIRTDHSDTCFFIPDISEYLRKGSRICKCERNLIIPTENGTKDEGNQMMTIYFKLANEEEDTKPNAIVQIRINRGSKWINADLVEFDYPQKVKVKTKVNPWEIYSLKLVFTYENCFEMVHILNPLYDSISNVNNNFYLIFIIFFAICLLLLTIIFKKLPIKNLFKRVSEMTNYPSQANNLNIHFINQENNMHYISCDLVDKEFEIKRSKLKTIKEIGSGAFGKVFFSKLEDDTEKKDHRMVAVKQLRNDAPPEEKKDFLSEISMLKQIGNHENIVKFIGCCTNEEPHLIVMELVLCGALKDYLINLREMWVRKKTERIHFFPDNTSPAPSSNFQFFDEYDMDIYYDEEGCPQHRKPLPSPTYKTCGKYLPIPQSSTSSSNQYSYNDSRKTRSTVLDNNCPTPLMEDLMNPPEPILSHLELQDFAKQIACGMAHLEKLQIVHRDLAARNILITNTKVLKITDFGMSRTGNYILQSSKKIPLRWMAIEAVENRQCDSKSDVWSFGIVLWEIATLGAFPYENIKNEMLLYNLKNGYRLQKPEICTKELYDLMLMCWNEKPDLRPTFQELELELRKLTKERRKMYIDFNEIRLTYVFPPTEELENAVRQKPSKN